MKFIFHTSLFAVVSFFVIGKSFSQTNPSKATFTFPEKGRALVNFLQHPLSIDPNTSDYRKAEYYCTFKGEEALFSTIRTETFDATVSLSGNRDEEFFYAVNVLKTNNIQPSFVSFVCKVPKSYTSDIQLFQNILKKNFGIVLEIIK